jgi:hypothetical protein
MGIVVLTPSTIVLATCQIEKSTDYGAIWQRFRLVAEQLESEKSLFINQAGRHAAQDDTARRALFVETVEGNMRGTDLSHFSQMVKPGIRIEKWFQYRLTSARRERPGVRCDGPGVSGKEKGFRNQGLERQV